jgi:hypothetical protein
MFSFVVSFFFCIVVQVQLIEAGDSTKTVVNQKDSEHTPCTKGLGKRSADNEESDVAGIEEIGEWSINIPVKLKCVKLEKDA